MTRLDPSHPRFASLRLRARLARAAREGLVVPEGLIAHGRGEAFDYFLGERTTPSAAAAERAAAAWLLAARAPVVSVNGNVAALAAPAIARLARALPNLRVEVNLFHRTLPRARAVAQALRAAGLGNILGVRPTATIPGLPSDRARVDARGIAVADVCLVPLEDGDRAEALRRLGKRVIAIDLNPLSRTSRAADLPIVDELRRALDGIRAAVPALRGRVRAGDFPPFNAAAARTAALGAMVRRLRAPAARAPPLRPGPAPASRRRARGRRRPRRRTPPA